MLPTLTKKAVEYIAERADGAKTGEPFFLYLPLSVAAHADRADARSGRARAG